MCYDGTNFNHDHQECHIFEHTEPSFAHVCRTDHYGLIVTQLLIFQGQIKRTYGMFFKELIEFVLSCLLDTCHTLNLYYFNYDLLYWFIMHTVILFHGNVIKMNEIIHDGIILISNQLVTN